MPVEQTTELSFYLLPQTSIPEVNGRLPELGFKALWYDGPWILEAGDPEIGDEAIINYFAWRDRPFFIKDPRYGEALLPTRFRVDINTFGRVIQPSDAEDYKKKLVKRFENLFDVIATPSLPSPEEL